MIELAHETRSQLLFSRAVFWPSRLSQIIFLNKTQPSSGGLGFAQGLSFKKLDNVAVVVNQQVVIIQNLIFGGRTVTRRF